MLRLLAVLALLFLQSEKNAAVGSKEEEKEIEEFKRRCPVSTCGGENGPEIRFPFRNESSLPDCGTPGMELSCFGTTTILKLPNLGSYNVTAIDYSLAAITVELSDSWALCPLQNLSSIDLNTPIYKPSDTVGVCLVSCSRKLPQNTTFPTSCLRSGDDRFVYVFDAQEYMDTLPSYCMVTSEVLNIPSKDYPGAQESLKEIVDDLVVQREITFSWSVHEITDICKDCEAAGKTCYFSFSRNTTFCKHPGEKHVKLISASAGKTHPRCRPFSCGPLRDIGFPFRSEGDPHECGDPRYQLACVDGNKTIWDIHQAETYYVTEISKNLYSFSYPYTSYYQYNNFRVVDADLANGSCSLPLQSLSRTSIENMRFKAEYFWWATFVSCTRKTVNSKYYPVPCLSKADAFVYVILSHGALQLEYAEHFCSFLAMTPITFDPERMKQMNGNIILLEHYPTTDDVFQLLKHGFSVPIYPVYSESSIGYCLKDAAM